MIKLSIQKSIRTVNGQETLAIDTTFPDNMITAIYGESGAGKTTLLRMVAGLANPEKGTILVNGNVWFSSEKKINLKTQKRKVGFVFQDYALFDNMTVKQNIQFALKDKKNVSLVNRLLEETQLSKLSNEFPSHISGGQKQRVALARALAQQPDVLLMDEPLSALDIETRIKLRELILELHDAYKMTTIFVSHDIPEIFSLANKVIKIKNGQITEYNSPKAAFDRAILMKQYNALFSFS